MSKPIKISYLWDKNLAIQSSKDIYEYELKNSNKRYIGWFFIALSQFGVVSALKHNAYGLLVISTILLIYWYMLRWPIRNFFINRSFNKSNFANKKIELEATKEAILSDKKVQIPYDSIKKFIQLDNAIVIYHTLGTIYLPNSAFESSKDRTAFKSYIKNALKP